jgi:hypothetical protein
MKVRVQTNSWVWVGLFALLLAIMFVGLFLIDMNLAV